jgi:hypothetical protein
MGQRTEYRLRRIRWEASGERDGGVKGAGAGQRSKLKLGQCPPPPRLFIRPSTCVWVDQPRRRLQRFALTHPSSATLSG